MLRSWGNEQELAKEGEIVRCEESQGGGVGEVKQRECDQGRAG